MKWKLSTSELLWWGAHSAVFGYMITLVSILAIFGQTALDAALPGVWKLVLLAPLIITTAWSRTLPETFERIEDDE